MSLKKDMLVPMPDTRVVFSKKAGNTYAYYITRSYRNEKGQPTNDRVIIGRKDDKTGKLVPNDRYFEIYGTKIVIKETSIKNYGTYFLLKSIIEQTGLMQVMEIVFPDKYAKLLTMAMYMASEGNVLYYCEDWCDVNHTMNDIRITSQTASRILQGVGHEDMERFFRKWVWARENQEYLAYDVTSISSYSQGSENVEWGYNRDNENLPQVNLALYYGEQSKLPIYYCIYPGSIPDKSRLAYMLRDNRLIDLTHVKFVMDKGFFTIDNLHYLVESGNRFIISVPLNYKAAQELIDKNRDSIINRSECRLGSKLPYVKAVITEAFGIRASVHIFYSPEKATDEGNALFACLDDMEETLSHMVTPPAKNTKYFKYFDIAEDKKGGILYKRNNNKVNKILSRHGFFLILETDFKLSSNEVLQIYRRKDMVEKAFDDWKNYVDMNRIRCHSDDTMESKLFVSFLSLILKCCLQHKLQVFLNKYNYTIEKVLKEMAKVKTVITPDGYTLMNPLTKKQKDILDAFGLADSDMLKELENPY